MLYFEPQLIASVAADILEGKGGSYEFVSPRLRDERLACRFRELVATATRDHEAELRCGEELLIKLVGRLIRPASALSSAVPTAIATARARIDDAPDAAVPLSILAAEVGLSRFQLLRGFEKATGLTPHAYRIQRRLHRVRRLIARGTPLAEASIACGFADQSHMTRLFVRIHGVSPGAYARAIG
jgi:AraC-like DNA-binding protein